MMDLQEFEQSCHLGCWLQLPLDLRLPLPWLSGRSIAPQASSWRPMSPSWSLQMPSTSQWLASIPEAGPHGNLLQLRTSPTPRT